MILYSGFKEKYSAITSLNVNLVEVTPTSAPLVSFKMPIGIFTPVPLMNAFSSAFPKLLAKCFTR